MKAKVKAGIVYLPSLAIAEAWRRDVRVEFPEARVVAYGLGWAVQVRVSGDYLGPNGRPTMETRMAAFDRA